MTLWIFKPVSWFLVQKWNHPSSGPGAKCFIVTMLCRDLRHCQWPPGQTLFQLSGEHDHTWLYPPGNTPGQANTSGDLCTIYIMCVQEEALVVAFSLLQFLHGFHGIILPELSTGTDFSPNHFQSFSSFTSPLTRKQNTITNKAAHPLLSLIYIVHWDFWALCFSHEEQNRADFSQLNSEVAHEQWMKSHLLKSNKLLLSIVELFLN